MTNQNTTLSTTQATTEREPTYSELIQILRYAELPAKITNHTKKGNLLDLVLPNGKKFRDCSGVEVSEMAAQAKGIADAFCAGEPDFVAIPPADEAKIRGAAMAKCKFLRTVSRIVNGEEFTFHVFTKEAMMHVYGLGDERPESTGRLYADDPGNVVIGSLIDNLLQRGTVRPGEWEAA